MLLSQLLKFKRDAIEIILALKTQCHTAKICIDLFSWRTNKLKFHCSVFDISLAEVVKMLKSIVFVLLCDWLTLSG